MEQRALGKTGINVSSIGIGAMPLSISGRPSTKQAIQVLHTAFDLGIDLVDTADVYCVDHRDIGHNERLIAQALKEWKGSASIVVATKGGLERPNGDWVSNGKPAHLKAACEASLKALNRECIDLYQLHAPDDRVPLFESIHALAELQKAGKISRPAIFTISFAQSIAGVLCSGRIEISQRLL